MINQKENANINKNNEKKLNNINRTRYNYSRKRRNKTKSHFKRKKVITINLDEEVEEIEESKSIDKNPENNNNIENIKNNGNKTFLNKKTSASNFKIKEEDNIDMNNNENKDNTQLNNENNKGNNNYYFDINDLNPDKFLIINNTITSKNLDKKKHYYVFFKEEFNIGKNQKGLFKIFFKILKDVDWLGFGICDKTIVKENNYIFDDEKMKNNGTYLLSVNSVSWNANNSSQFKNKIIKIDSSKLQKAGTIIECVFSSDKGFLDFFVENVSIIRLTNIILFKSESYTPCIVFLKDCSVEVSVEYP